MGKIPDKMFTAKEAADCGLPRWRLAQMVDTGELERVSRGVYMKSGANGSTMPEVEVLVARGTDFVVALESALWIHEFSTATPHELWIALRRGARTPKVDFPLKIVRVDDRSFDMGAEWRNVQGVRARVYSPAKTVADLFKFRNKIGMERALEALKDGLRRRLFTVDELLKCAKVDRVFRIIVPYIEGYFG